MLLQSCLKTEPQVSNVKLNLESPAFWKVAVADIYMIAACGLSEKCSSNLLHMITHAMLL
jgi:hypothetical protein